jgi:drug/metabolite transporter (DMT)-like permease
VRRVLIGGTMLLVFGLLFIIRGITEGNGSEVAIGIPGLLLGIAALISFKADGESRPPK